MFRVPVVLILGAAASAAVIAFLEQAAPDGLNQQTLVLLRAVEVEDFDFSSAGFRGNDVLVVSGTVPGGIYAGRESSSVTAARALRAVAALYIDRRLPRHPPGAAIRLVPREDILLTEDIPRYRCFERAFTDILAEETLDRRLPGVRVRELHEGRAVLDVGEYSIGRLLEPLLEALGEQVFSGVEGFVVGERFLDRTGLHLLLAAKRNGFEPEETEVTVEDSDMGEVVSLVSPPGRPPEVFPPALSVDDPEPLNVLGLEEALLDAYRTATGVRPAGILISVKGETQFQYTSDLELRIAEKKNAVLWGDRRFRVKKDYHRGWKYIIIHHTATDSATFRSIDRYHREVKGWEHGTGYHFVIGNGNGFENGEIFATPRWQRQLHGAHAGNAEWNRKSIGIALVGDFEAYDPTPEQMDALVRLSRYLVLKFGIPLDHIMGHCDCPAAQTLCPGCRFPRDEYIRDLAGALKVQKQMSKEGR